MAFRISFFGKAGRPMVAKDVDAAMWKVFESYPRASFSYWNESQTEEWLDIFDGSRNVGKIVGDI